MTCPHFSTLLLGQSDRASTTLVPAHPRHHFSGYPHHLGSTTWYTAPTPAASSLCRAGSWTQCITVTTCGHLSRHRELRGQGQPVGSWPGSTGSSASCRSKGPFCSTKSQENAARCHPRSQPRQLSCSRWGCEQSLAVGSLLTAPLPTGNVPCSWGRKRRLKLQGQQLLADGTDEEGRTESCEGL